VPDQKTAPKPTKVQARQIAEELAQFERDVEYFSSQYDALMRAHAGQWVAIYQGKVVALADSPQKLIETLQDCSVPRSRTVMEHLDPDAIAAF
jgi:hypothetical protein